LKRRGRNSFRFQVRFAGERGLITGSEYNLRSTLMGKCVCQHCSQSIEFPDQLAGQEVACPVCAKPTRLPRSGPPMIKIPAPPPRPGTSPEPVGTGVSAVVKRMIDNIETVVVGKRDKILLAMVTYFSEGHLLLEDVPGVAKTMLARAIAQSVGGSFKRLQCTPDLLPNDITGASIFNPKTTEFEFRPGPVFAQIVLADEINRTTPRTQSALLEAMS